MSQQYSLRWNNHQPNFISMFTTLLNTQTLVDVTLAAEGKHLQAHKVVLSACSTYFQALFVDNPSRHPIVILKDVTFADLRTMVDFMYYGEVNVTEEQLPQVLDTAKLLKIKGLTEMPETTSLTRSQGTSADFQTAEHHEAQRLSATPPSPSIKRKRRRKSSTGSTSVNMVEDARDENQTVELVRDGITLSSVPPRRREYHDDRHQDTSQQTTETHNMTMDALAVENNPAGMPPGTSTESLPQTETSETSTLCQRPNLYQTVLRELTGRRTKVLRRQERVAAWLGGEHTRSEPGASSTVARAPLRQHASYPLPGTESGAECARASHTPAVRAGPPLSCNFCWNTVDEAGRILRRKTQYHCPECRTNLCIVPCFHEYHADDSEPEVK